MIGDQLLIKDIQLRITEDEYLAASGLALDKLISKTELRNLNGKLLQVKLEIADLRRQRAEAKLNNRVLLGRRDAAHDEVEIRNAVIDARLADIEERSIEAQRVFIISSPADGRISSLSIKPGEMLTPSMLMMSITPRHDQVRAELWVPSSALGFIRVGNRVALMLDAFPYQKFGVHPAVVTGVDSSPTQLIDLPEELRSAGEPLFRVTAKPTTQYFGPDAKPLVAGYRLSAEILLEERTIAQWIFEPISSAFKHQAKN